MNEVTSSFVKFFTSLKLTVVLLALSILLIFFATLDQVNLGIWAVQEKYFRSFVVLANYKGIPIPVMPGGYFVGGLLLVNLIASHLYRFKLTAKKVGIQLVHFGLILLLIGELLSGLLQEEYQMRLDEGGSSNYSESSRYTELAIVDTSPTDHDTVVAIPEKLLAQRPSVQNPQLPFRVEVREYFPNAAIQMRAQAAAAPGAIQPEVKGFGNRLAFTPLPLTYKENERNLPAALIELIGPEGSLGTWLVSAALVAPETFDYADRSFRLSLRFERNYKPYSLKLVDFSHDKYPGTEIPKNFSSKVQLTTPDGQVDREVLIYMNNPLRYDGLTFYQASFANNDTTSILQVVRNPGWLIPYISCALMALGLLYQFGAHLIGFIAKRAKA